MIYGNIYCEDFTEKNYSLCKPKNTDRLFTPIFCLEKLLQLGIEVNTPDLNRAGPSLLKYIWMAGL